MCHKIQRIYLLVDEVLSISNDSAPLSLLNKFVTVISITKQFCVLKVTSNIRLSHKTWAT